MTNVQLYLSIGVPGVLALLGVALNLAVLIRMASVEKSVGVIETKMGSLETRFGVIESDMRQFYRSIGKVEGRMDEMQK